MNFYAEKCSESSFSLIIKRDCRGSSLLEIAGKLIGGQTTSDYVNDVSNLSSRAYLVHVSFVTCDLFCLFLSRVFSLSPQKSTNGGINKLESVIEVLTDHHQLIIITGSQILFP
jgi:hypothetical protein